MAFRLLAVLAHPDDESFGPGGTLALYAQRGVEIHLACATRGEAGGIPMELAHKNLDTGQLREAELRCAAGVLGLTGVHMLNYRDSGMPGSRDNIHPRALAAAPVDEVAAKIAALIREIQPQVVITFDPIGGYRHPDHIAVHQATVRAYRLAADPAFHSENLPPYSPQKLYYHTFSRRWLRTMVRLMPLLGKDPRKWGRNGDIDMTAIANQNFPINTRIKISSVAEIKKNASACHKSQLQNSSSSSSLLSRLIVAFNPYEDFMRADPPVIGAAIEKDLLAGVHP
ncbi:MAG: PIG-L family deacetylase [Anaerolineales bacterium]|nr:PIG-L family deacetylase [Anaerolineales bacterium]